MYDASDALSESPVPPRSAAATVAPCPSSTPRDRGNARVHPFTSPTARNGDMGQLFDMELRVARLSSQHLLSDYNMARRRSQARANHSSSKHARALAPRSSLTSLNVETPAALYRHDKADVMVQAAPLANLTAPDDPDDITFTKIDLSLSRPDASAASDRSLPEPATDSESPLPSGPYHLDGLPRDVKTSVTHPINLSALIPPDLLDIFGWYYLGHGQDSGRSGTTDLMPPLRARPSSPLRVGAARSEAALAKQISLPHPGDARVTKAVTAPFHLLQHSHHLAHPAPLDLWFLTQTQTQRADLRPDGLWSTTLASASLPLSAIQTPPAYGGPGPVGNILLSSCPGKKVRLSGPARGVRGAINRDLRLDLQTIKGEGAHAIVCLLDDAELALLGAPWWEYSTVASDLGLAVYRLPMAEGCGAPSSARLDDLLERIVAGHTLRGQSVLIHCRGGVGRAGLVACAWMLKMQVVPGHGLTAMTLVERVIDVVRRRRSVKAIETPAQVVSLLDYVHYLRHHTKAVMAEDVLASPPAHL